MCFCGPIYRWGPWHHLTRYIQSMTTYGLCLNADSLSDRGITHVEGQRLYVDGWKTLLSRKHSRFNQ